MDKEIIKKIKNKIMSYEEFSSNSHKTPYIFEVSAKEKAIYFYGIKHSGDPKNPIFDEVEKAFENFNPGLVLVEARESLHSEIEKLSRDDVIKRFGDPGFATYLALQNNMRAECPEPSTESMIEEIISEGYSKDTV